MALRLPLQCRQWDVIAQKNRVAAYDSLRRNLMKNWAMYVLLAALPAASPAADPYLTLGAGASAFRDAEDVEDMVPGADIDDESTALMIGIGGDVGKGLMVEGGYLSLGKAEERATNLEFKARAVTATALPYLQAGDARVFLRVGAAYWQAGNDLVKDRNGWAPVGGLGIEYMINDEAYRWSLRAEWMRIMDIGTDHIGKTDVDAAMLGLVLRY